MNHHYLPMTEADRKAMLEAIGISDVEELFADIPASVRFKGELNIPDGRSERELMQRMRQLAEQNADFEQYACFLGAGIYDHAIPVVLNHILSRSEFYTAYTPYQPEISQGELQAIFEFQSMICELTGMAVANASMYDGATALAEAGLLACSVTRRKRLVVSAGVHPESRQILLTYAKGQEIEIVEVENQTDGTLNIDDLKEKIDDTVAAVLIQSPNFFGCLENIRAIEPLIHANGGLLVVSCNPMSLALCEAPGVLGADLVVGDTQPFGISASLGGPTCGYFAASQKWMRKMPGRIVGQTVDQDGKRGFVLTLQTREQHIRREKATSNICSNQALLALTASVYLAVMGKEGLRETAYQNVQKAHYAAERLSQIEGVKLPFQAPFFNEFVLEMPIGTDVEKVNQQLLNKGFIGGYALGKDYADMGNRMLVAVTEQRTKAEIDRFAEALEEVL